MPSKIVFMGTSKFSIPALDILIKNHYNILSVYSQPPKRSKRGQKINVSPLHKFADKNNLPIRNPTNLNSEEELNFIKKLSPDLVIVVAYGKIFPKFFLKTAKFGFLNIHASLLPKWRGAAPIQRAIINQDRKIGVSIMKIQEELDAGPVLSTWEMVLNPNLTYGEVEEKLAEEGAKLLIDSLKKIENDKFNFINQPNSEATYAKKINKAECKINWHLTADEIIAVIHGLNPNPGAWFEYKTERFKVWKAKKSFNKGIPGTILDNNLSIACKSDSIQVLEIQREGKKKQQVKDFLLGTKISKGIILN